MSEPTIRGLVIEALPGCNFSIQLPEMEEPIRCYMCGKMYKNKIRVLVGDEVEVVLSSDKKIGRIMRRL